jgi:hypothetical protein
LSTYKDLLLHALQIKNDYIHCMILAIYNGVLVCFITISMQYYEIKKKTNTSKYFFILDQQTCVS